jgi:hypothetical protein
MGDQEKPKGDYQTAYGQDQLFQNAITFFWSLPVFQHLDSNKQP